MELLEGDMTFFLCLAYEVSYLKVNLVKFLRNLRKPNLWVCKQKRLNTVPLTLRSPPWSGGVAASRVLCLPGRANLAILVWLPY